MSFQYEQPELQKLYEEGHPFFVAWAWAMQQERKELEIIYANEQNNQLATQKRLKQFEDFAQNLIQQLAERGENVTELQQKLNDIKQQRLGALTAANEKRSTEAILKHEQWQAWANDAWKQYPQQNKTGMALHIIELHNIDAEPGTVADVLRKPDFSD